MSKSETMAKVAASIADGDPPSAPAAPDAALVAAEIVKRMRDGDGLLPVPEKCGNCRYWRPRLYDGSVRECRVNPPMFAPTQTRAAWPPVHEDQWCGRFAPTQEAFAAAMKRSVTSAEPAA